MPRQRVYKRQTLDSEFRETCFDRNINMATQTSTQQTPPSAQLERIGVQILTMHKDRISADALDLKDPYGRCTS
jgi:hypothetical protein